MLTLMKQIKVYCYSSTKNACRLEFVDHLWLPFLDQTQSDIVVFGIINFQIYNIIVSKRKHGIGHIYMITFNEEL